MGSIITLQVGQCGNQIGAEFWSRIAKDHGISSDGSAGKRERNERKDVFFYESCEGKFFPRSILVDLEPRVVSQVINEHPQLFSRESVFVGSEGGGAGNVWASGYQQGKNNSEVLLDLVQREAEGCDILDGFIMFHSVGGGTGSGLGSFLLEEIRDKIPKTVIQTISVLPNNEEVSDAVVQPYNSVLALRRLKECADGVVAMDNGMLARSVGDSLKMTPPTFAYANRLVSAVSAACTSTFRFPGSRFSDISSFLSLASPVPDCHFLVPSYSPFFEHQVTAMRKTTCLDVQRKLALPKSRLVGFEESETNCHLAALNLMQGVEPGEVEKSLLRIKQRGLLRFAPWAPPIIQVAICNAKSNNVSGLLLGNTTGIARALSKISAQYDRLKQRNAFIDMYKREGQEHLEEFHPARESLESLVLKYRAAELSTFCPNG